MNQQVYLFINKHSIKWFVINLYSVLILAILKVIEAEYLTVYMIILFYK